MCWMRRVLRFSESLIGLILRFGVCSFLRILRSIFSHFLSSFLSFFVCDGSVVLSFGDQMEGSLFLFSMVSFSSIHIACCVLESVDLKLLRSTDCLIREGKSCHIFFSSKDLS